jgi:nucleotide-binding universal stress UspA family protein
MKFADILICIDGSAIGQSRLKSGLALAARSGARVLGYYVASPRELPGEGIFSLLTTDDTPMTETIDTAEAEFTRQLVANSTEGEWVLGSRSIDDLLKYARCADLVVVGLGDPDMPSADPQGLDVERLVLECGRPVLGIPIANVPETIGKNVMVAWDAGRASARALHDAIPFLRDAEAISIVSVDIDPLSSQSPAHVVEHLERLGITAKVDTTMSLDLPIGEEILSRVDWEDIDLLVAGAFGHSRVWEHLFGGPSMTLIHQMMVPVLVSH